MPQRLIMSLKNISYIVGLAAAIFGGIQAYANMQFKVESNSRRIDKLELDHDILIQIAQDVKNIKERMQR